MENWTAIKRKIKWSFIKQNYREMENWNVAFKFFSQFWADFQEIIYNLLNFFELCIFEYFFFLFIFSNLGQQRFFIRGKREKRESGKKRLHLHDLDSDVAVAILFAKKN